MPYRNPIELPGTFNVRDLGGMPTADGRELAPGRLFRGELLAYPGASPIHAQWDRDGDYGIVDIATVVDLRAIREVESTPSAWPEALRSPRVLHFPIDDGGDGAETDYVQQILTRELDRFTPEHMAAHYIALLDRRATTLAPAVSAISEGGPVLVHCAAGKDRTGILIALVLDVLGVPSDVIVADYALTGELKPDRALDYTAPFTERGVDLEDYRVLFETPSLAMTTLLEHLHRGYGSAEAYLVEAGGLDSDVIPRLRRALLAS
jgi:protein-tyrosine phosphatase